MKICQFLKDLILNIQIIFSKALYISYERKGVIFVWFHVVSSNSHDEKFIDPYSSNFIGHERNEHLSWLHSRFLHSSFEIPRIDVEEKHNFHTGGDNKLKPNFQNY